MSFFLSLLDSRATGLTGGCFCALSASPFLRISSEKKDTFSRLRDLWQQQILVSENDPLQLSPSPSPSLLRVPSLRSSLPESPENLDPMDQFLKEFEKACREETEAHAVLMASVSGQNQEDLRKKLGGILKSDTEDAAVLKFLLSELKTEAALPALTVLASYSDDDLLCYLAKLIDFSQSHVNQEVKQRADALVMRLSNIDF